MSHTSFNTVIEEFPAMLFAVSIDGQFHLWNKESEQITGYSASEAELNKEFSKKFFVVLPY
jgi:PAS domain S-box-containing protein